MTNTTQEKHVLILEDEAPLRNLYEKRLRRKGYHVEGYSTAEDGLKAIEKKHFHVALVDIRMPGLSGLDFLKLAKEKSPFLEIIMITAYGSIESAVKAMKLGAYDYLTKPCHLPELEMLVEKALEKNILQQQNLRLKEALRAKDIHGSMVYTSPKMAKIMGDVEKVASTDSPVIIQGESGTGKELVANIIHKLSIRKDGPFIAINCANLQDNLAENELFGHEKGAYTGAANRKQGLLELADQGTLFIDEISEMHPSTQAKLLRVLENKTFRRLGAEQELYSDVRIIAATNRNLAEEVSKGRFRHDLFFRLNVVTLQIPPLRERREDIPLLVEHFLELKGRSLNVAKTIAPSATEKLLDYDWPGNVRELANVIERALILSSGDIIEPKDLLLDENLSLRPDLIPLSNMERRHILNVLRHTKGNKTQAAKILGISVRNLYRKISQYKLNEVE